MCELAGAHAGASFVRGKAVVRMVPTTTWATTLVGIVPFSSLGALCVVKTATDLLASAGEYRAIALLVAGIPCCGSWALARGGAGSLHLLSGTKGVTGDAPDQDVLLQHVPLMEGCGLTSSRRLPK